MRLAPRNPAIALLLVLTLTAAAADATVVPGAWAPVGGQLGAAFGTSIAPAGDVNGDGFGDVLVGAPQYDNGQADEGRAYLYLGSATGLASSPAWTWESNQAGANAGALVAPAGDVNKDGSADILIGAPQWDEPGHVDAGAVFVFYGNPDGPPLTPSLKLVNGVTDSRFGTSACTAGDVNNDEYADVIVGAPRFTNGQSNEGAVYVFHGSGGGLASVPAITIEGNEIDARAGASVSSAGDMNADTFGEVIYGAPGSSPSAVVAAGKAVVLGGSVTGITGVVYGTITGSADSMATGTVVSLAGDMNGDGYADVAVGSPGAASGGTRRGTVVVYPGNAAGVILGPYLTIAGMVDQERLGSSLATAGDVDGDGFADLVLGRVRYPSVAGATGRILIYGGGHQTASVLAGFDGTAVGARFAAAVATAGDFNGDGFAEVLVGVPDFGTPGLELEGAARSFVGSASKPSAALNSPLVSANPGADFSAGLAILPFADADAHPGLLVTEPSFQAPPVTGQAFVYHPTFFTGLPLTPNFTLSAPPGASAFGQIAADAGSVERDELSDFVVGAPVGNLSDPAARGRVFLFRGDYGGPVLDAWDAHADSASDNFGAALAGRGDVNGDGYTDVLVGGDAWSSPTKRNVGKVWLYLGGPTGLGAASWSAQGTATGQQFGHTVAFADLDADGYSDAVIGSIPIGSPAPGDAHVDVYFGGPGGLPVNPAYTITPSPPAASFGFAIAGVGDVDGDAVCDLAIGAPKAVGDAGEVFLYRGSKARSQPVAPVTVLFGSGNFGEFGFAIAGGGDLDGDALADFVIGEPYYSNGESGEGRVLVYHGTKAFASLAPDTTFESNVADRQVGLSLTPLADLNGDGFADIVAGTLDPQVGGRTYVWYGGGEGAHRRFQTTEFNCAGCYRFGPTNLDNAAFVGAGHTVRTPAGRDRVGQEIELRLQDEPFTGVPNLSTGSLYYQTGAPGTIGSTLQVGSFQTAGAAGTTYHWRARVFSRSPYFPRSRWIVPEGRLTGGHDFRTAGAEVSVSGPAGASVCRLGRIAPNPSPGAAVIPFSLAVRATMRLDVYDVLGRHVRTLARGEAEAGPGERRWDGLDDAGQRVRPGLYFVELRAGSAVDRSRIVRLD